MLVALSNKNIFLNSKHLIFFLLDWEIILINNKIKIKALSLTFFQKRFFFHHDHLLQVSHFLKFAFTRFKW